MRGYRKMAVVGGVLGALLGGLALAKSEGMYVAFAAAAVAAGGWFFKTNVETHKVQGNGEKLSIGGA